ncbi:porin [Ahrensia marina]|uniref:Porin n=1 Tax=Ahrensia marina TaxID=1514904 RepID=A0A0M9GPJ9_9HYPH|nr:porin [Ahrensia marina]KPB02356.1 hypothetical protein SU32_03620 [Ahrensia marina]
MLERFSLGTLIFYGLISAAYAGEPIDLKSQIIAEPESDEEHVQACEAAGPGFKYIPGTRTCIRISGHVRYEINVTSK